MTRLLLISIVSLWLHALSVHAQAASASVLLQKDLKDIPDREAVMLTVEYAPGESSPMHRHNAHTFVYVLEGTVIMQVEGGDSAVLDAGETFYETPDDVHLVSKNASSSESAKILVFFVKRAGAPATVGIDEHP